MFSLIRLSSIAFCVGLLAFCTPSAHGRAVAKGEDVVKSVEYPGMQHLTYRYGPIMVKPGQNSIRVADTDLRPKVPGFITRFEPNMIKVSDGSVPSASILHMHHVAWLLNKRPVFLGVEEKTIIQYPRSFGLKVSGKEFWRLNFMLHNWVTKPEKVYLTWDIDFVPLAKGSRLRPLRSHWMDVAGIQTYPVFDALRRPGRERFVFPDNAGKQQHRIGSAATWLIERPITLVHAISHLHPGGLFNDLVVTRGSRSRRMLRSYARYYQSADPVSWNYSVSASTPDWRIKLKPGDTVSLKTTYDVSQASWYEAMGIMPLAFYQGWDIGGQDAFAAPSGIWRRSRLTHGQLAENRSPGGRATLRSDPRGLPDGPTLSKPVQIQGFSYQFGDLNRSGRLAAPPVVPAGQPISFVNLDSTIAIPEQRSIYHTVTSCREPCTRSEGLAFPLADGAAGFDSGQLGYGLGVGSEPNPPSANRNTWVSPVGLTPGTYTYFCRVHPFMRGAFRVKEGDSGNLSAGWRPLPGRGVWQ